MQFHLDLTVGHTRLPLLIKWCTHTSPLHIIVLSTSWPTGRRALLETCFFVKDLKRTWLTMPSVFSTSSSTCSSISAGVYQYQLLKTMQLDSATRDFIGLTIMKKTRSYTIADKYSSGKSEKANIAVHSCWHKCDNFESDAIWTKLARQKSLVSLDFFFVKTSFWQLTTIPLFLRL